MTANHVIGLLIFSASVVCMIIESQSSQRGSRAYWCLEIREQCPLLLWDREREDEMKREKGERETGMREREYRFPPLAAGRFNALLLFSWMHSLFLTHEHAHI